MGIGRKIPHHTLIEVQPPIRLPRSREILLSSRQLQGEIITLRPRKYTVPSYRPNQITGYVDHPQYVTGSVEGQNPSNKPKSTLWKIVGAERTSNQVEGVLGLFVISSNRICVYGRNGFFLPRCGHMLVPIVVPLFARADPFPP